MRRTGSHGAVTFCKGDERGPGTIKEPFSSGPAPRFVADWMWSARITVTPTEIVASVNARHDPEPDTPQPTRFEDPSRGCAVEASNRGRAWRPSTRTAGDLSGCEG